MLFKNFSIFNVDFFRILVVILNFSMLIFLNYIILEFKGFLKVM